MTKLSLQTHLPRTHRISAARRETANVQTFTFDASLGAEPGQFVMLWVPGVDEIPMSVAHDDGKQLSVTFFAVGEATKILAQKKVGDPVGLRGPFGTRFRWQKNQHLALVAGGYGVAPLLFTARRASADGCRVEAIVGARSAEHLLCLDAFGSLGNVTLHVATDDGSKGHKGYGTDILAQLLQSGDAVDGVLACGPELMLQRAMEVADAAGVPSQLSMERYMKCGYGLCGNCTVDPLGIRLCVEGPVIPGDLAKKIGEFGKYHRDELGRKHAF